MLLKNKYEIKINAINYILTNLNKLIIYYIYITLILNKMRLAGGYLDLYIIKIKTIAYI